MKTRCEWCGSDPLDVAYHDDEWGVPVHDDRILFEMLNLEGAQAGLSWRTILRKRDATGTRSMVSTSRGSQRTPRPTSNACSAIQVSCATA